MEQPQNYVLMHKEEAVANLSTGNSFHDLTISKLLKPEHLPFSLSETTYDTQFSTWLKGRTIPDERMQPVDQSNKFDLDPYELLSYCFGFSLSDHYWIKPEGFQINWKEHNFFEHPFSEWMKKLLFSLQSSFTPEDLNSPDNSTGGNLPKYWQVIKDTRYLFKTGSPPFFQEPINEEIASLLFRKLEIPHVDYETVNLAYINKKKDPEYYSMCKCFTNTELELISCDEIIQHFQVPLTYSNFIECCLKLGIEDIRKRVNEMIVADFILANQDRHTYNFGLLRDSSTLKFVSFAPIYDTGNSLQYNSPSFNTSYTTDYSKPFAKRHYLQIKFVTDFSWLDFEKLKDFDKEVEQILNNSWDTKDRIEGILNFIRHRIDLLKIYIDSITKDPNFDPEYDKRFNPFEEHFVEEEGEEFDPFELNKQ